MKLPLPGSALGRVSLIFTGLLAISAAVPLPLPIETANRLLAGRAEHLQVGVDRAWIRWSRGEIGVENLRVLHQGEERVHVRTLHTFLDLWPWSPAFGKPILLELEEPHAMLDLELIEEFLRLRSKNPLPFPLRLRVSDADIGWQEEGRVVQADGMQLRGSLSPEGARLNLDATLRQPGVGDLSIRADAGEGLASWTAEARFDVAATGIDEYLKGMPLALDEARAAGRAWVELEDGNPEVRVDLEADAPALTWTDGPATVRELGLTIKGSLGGRLHATLDAVDEVLPLRVHATLDDALDRRALELRTSARGVVADEALVRRLIRLAPTLEEVLVALEPRGPTDADFLLRHRRGGRVEWGLRVAGDQVGMTWRGIVDESSGEKISFPYPVRRAAGDLWVGHDVLLYQTRAELEQQGTARSTGSFDFRGDAPTRFALDLEAEDVAIDRRLPNALAGNPELADLYRELGSPEGGSLDFGLHMREVDDLRIEVVGEARGFTAVPRFLPLTVESDHAWFRWHPGIAEFGGMMRALGSDMNLYGQAIDDHADALRVELDLRGQGLAPTEAEVKTLESYLPLPDGTSAFLMDGPVHFDLGMRTWPDDPERLQLKGHVAVEGARVAWRGMGLDFTPFHAQADFIARDDRFLLVLPRVWTQLEEGRLLASLVASPFPGRSDAVVEAQGLRVNSRRVRDLQMLIGEADWGGHLDWSGAVDLAARVDPQHPEDFDATVVLDPLEMVPRDAPGAAPMRLTGSIIGSPGRFSSTVLGLEGEHVTLALRELSGSLEDDGVLQAEARLAEGTVLALEEELAALIGPEARAAFAAVGLGGRLRANDVLVRGSFDVDGRPHLFAEGSLTAEDLELDGPLDLAEVQARLVVERAELDGEALSAAFRIEDGQGFLGGMRIGDSRAAMELTPELLTMSDFRASLLGGVLRSDGIDEEGQEIAGTATLGLTREAPVSVECFLEGLQLDRMREELGLKGSLAGVLDGSLRMRSPTPNPTFALGRGRLQVSDGALGTVPVLRTMWRIAGIDPPVFDTANLAFRLNGEGRVYVDELKLDSRLLEVQGQGSVDMDSSLNLKVTIRTFSLLGRLPVVMDLLDWLVEQQVYGPIEAPLIRQRSLRKLAGQNFMRPAFPLWVPEPPKPDWRRSPIVPLDAGLE